MLVSACAFIRVSCIQRPTRGFRRYVHTATNPKTAPRPKTQCGTAPGLTSLCGNLASMASHCQLSHDLQRRAWRSSNRESGAQTGPNSAKDPESHKRSKITWTPQWLQECKALSTPQRRRHERYSPPSHPHPTFKHLQTKTHTHTRTQKRSLSDPLPKNRICTAKGAPPARTTAL